MIKPNFLFRNSALQQVAAKLNNRFAFADDKISEEEIVRSWLNGDRVQDLLDEHSGGTEENKEIAISLDASDLSKTLQSLLSEKNKGNASLQNVRLSPQYIDNRIVSSNYSKDNSLRKFSTSNFITKSSITGKKLFKNLTLFNTTRGNSNLENKFTYDKSKANLVPADNRIVSNIDIVKDSFGSELSDKRSIQSIFQATSNTGFHSSSTSYSWLNEISGGSRPLRLTEKLLFHSKDSLHESFNSALKETSLLGRESSLKEKEADSRLRAVASKEKLTNGDFSSIMMGNKKDEQSAPVYNITQNFGDIVIQPANVELGVHQLKGKLEDILRKVRDSVHR